MLIVLIVLSLAIPLAQAVNFFVGILYDAVILLMAASRTTEEEAEEVAGAASASGNVQRVKEAKKEEAKKKDAKKKETQANRLSNVFSRSRNKGTKGAGPSDGDKAVEWPQKSPMELATQRDVNRAVAALRSAVAGLMAKNELRYDDRFALLAKILYDMRFIRYEALRSFTINELAKIQVDLERLRDIEVGGLRSYATKSISEVRQLIDELKRQNGGGRRAVLSRQNRPPSTNPFDASAVRGGVFGALAERAQAWFGSRGRVAYDEVSPASEDDEYTDDYHVDDATPPV